MEIYFATGNKHKFEETEKILSKYAITVRHFQFEHREIRSDSLEEIAQEACNAAYKQCKKPVFVDDTGLFIESLNGFPGTFSAWGFRKVGIEGILNLLKDKNDRSAYFQTTIAYHNGKGIVCFNGKCIGQIAKKSAGTSGFGYDPIFIPIDEKKTFAQSIELKNKLSHRYKALLEFCKYLNKH